MIAFIICLLIIISGLIWQAIQLMDQRDRLLEEIQRLRNNSAL